MKIAAVIPTYNRKPYLKNLLQQLHTQKVKNILLDIVVVVDGSTDGTLEMLRSEFPDIQIVNGPGNWWFTKSLNEGLKYAKQLKSDAVLILNDDSEIESDYLATLVEEHQRIEEGAVLGSITLTKNTHIVTYSGVRKIKWWRYKRYQHLPFNSKFREEMAKAPLPTLTLTARGTLVPYHALIALNYFDEKHFPQYGSDDDFALKANKNGVPVYISFKCQLFDNTELTGKGSPRLIPTFGQFFLSMFNKYSPVYVLNNIRLTVRYGGWWLAPISPLVLFAGTFYRFFKYRRMR